MMTRAAGKSMSGHWKKEQSDSSDVAAGHSVAETEGCRIETELTGASMDTMRQDPRRGERKCLRLKCRTATCRCNDLRQG